MTITQALLKIDKAGFRLSVDGPDLIIKPPGKLSPAQRQYIVDHKVEIMAALLDAAPAGNDHRAANDDKVLVAAWTPAGNPVEFLADNQDHADWIIRMNPKPPEHLPGKSQKPTDENAHQGAN